MLAVQYKKLWWWLSGLAMSCWFVITKGVYVNNNNNNYNNNVCKYLLQCHMIGPPLWSSGQFLARDTEVSGSIPRATRFSE